MLGPVGIDTHAPSASTARTLQRLINGFIRRSGSLRGCRRNLLPAVRAFFYVRIVSIGPAAVIPIAGCQRLGGRLLDISRWRGYHRGIVVRIVGCVRVVIIRRVPSRADKDADTGMCVAMSAAVPAVMCAAMAATMSAAVAAPRESGRAHR